MVTGYEADFYRQFGDLVKTSHQIVQALENLRKQLEENNVSRDLNDQSETTLVEAIQELAAKVEEGGSVDYTPILLRISNSFNINDSERKYCPPIPANTSDRLASHLGGDFHQLSIQKIVRLLQAAASCCL